MDPDSPRLCDFMIAWICVLRIEYFAALGILDQQYDSQLVTKADRDENTYTLGRIGKHSIVIVVPRAGSTGLAHASVVSSDLKSSFPSVRFALIVGIGGGAPTPKSDIRLGDVIFGTNIVPYRFGKQLREGHTKQAPNLLRSKITELQSLVFQGLNLQRYIDKVARNCDPTGARQFRRPTHDTLCVPYHDHLGASCDCHHLRAREVSAVVHRAHRPEGQMVAIHEGTVASADQVMKDARLRDEIAHERDALCFEMESAGVAERMGCLPIRGISDYSDSHKNDEWQPFAALSSAVCAKLLLSVIQPSEVSSIKLEVTQKDIARFIDSAIYAVHQTTTEQAGMLGETAKAVDMIQSRVEIMRSLVRYLTIDNEDNKEAIEQMKDSLQHMGDLEAKLDQAVDQLKQVIRAQTDLSQDYVTRTEWEDLQRRVDEQSSKLKTMIEGTTDVIIAASELLVDIQGPSQDSRLGPISQLLSIMAKYPEIFHRVQTSWQASQSSGLSRDIPMTSGHATLHPQTERPRGIHPSLLSRLLSWKNKSKQSLAQRDGRGQSLPLLNTSVAKQDCQYFHPQTYTRHGQSPPAPSASKIFAEADQDAAGGQPTPGRVRHIARMYNNGLGLSSKARTDNS